jgi:hypothetical protein
LWFETRQQGTGCVDGAYRLSLTGECRYPPDHSTGFRMEWMLKEYLEIA